MALAAPLLGSVFGLSAGFTSAVGLGVSALGLVTNTLAQRQSTEQAAQVARNDAQLAQQSAEQSAAEIREDTLRRVGVQKAVRAASGIVATAGSSLLTTDEQFKEGEKEIFKTEQRGIQQQAAATSRLSAAKQKKSDVTQQGILTGTSLLRR